MPPQRAAKHFSLHKDQESCEPLVLATRRSRFVAPASRSAGVPPAVARPSRPRPTLRRASCRGALAPKHLACSATCCFTCGAGALAREALRRRASRPRPTLRRASCRGALAPKHLACSGHLLLHLWRGRPRPRSHTCSSRSSLCRTTFGRLAFSKVITRQHCVCLRQVQPCLLSAALLTFFRRR